MKFLLLLLLFLGCSFLSIQACTHNSVRLVGASGTTNEGRVEVCRNGAWGTVCDDRWDDNDATVVCRELGWPTQGAEAFSLSFFGAGTGPIFFDEVQCTGSEAQLALCPLQTSNDCSHSEDAGVRCQGGSTTSCGLNSVRLVGGASSNEGRVEVCIDGTSWGTVCDDFFGSPDARVVCRQLSLPTGGAIPLTDVDPGGGSIVLDDVACVGTELRLTSCPHSTNPNCRTHDDDVGVRCQEAECTTENAVRLVGGATQFEGRVEICNFGTWGTVCDNSWDTPDAVVTCTQLRFPTGGAEALSHAVFGEGTGRILFDSVMCTGSEQFLISCPSSETEVCSHSDDVGVRCLDAPTTVPSTTTGTTPSPTAACSHNSLRLVGGTSSQEGRVEVCRNGVWGTVCDDSWSTEDATVVCRQLGFFSGGAIAISRAHFGQGTGPIFFDDVSCTGSEVQLALCSLRTTDINCAHSEDAGVNCQAACTHNSLRLVGGTSSLEGRVEVCRNEVWGTVCDDFWNSDDATVVCRQLGFSTQGAVAFSRATFGEGTGSIFFDNVQCTGSELQLASCPLATTHNCGHSEDAGVRCQGVPTTTPSVCPGGYTGNGTDCIDINECANSFTCNPNATCTNTPGSFNCTCVQGFRGNGVECYDIDECANVTTNNCDSDATCTNTPGSFTCTCNQGYIGNGTNCVVCFHNSLRLVGGMSSQEGRVEVCRNGVWGTVCDDFWGSNDATVVCRQLGFAPEGAQAFFQAHFGAGTGSIFFDDVACTGSELQLASCPLSTTHNCVHSEDAGVRCLNVTTPSACPEGYTGSGANCIDINECADSFSCNPNATCTNTPGSFICTCVQGFRGNGVECYDIDECANVTTNNCDSDATCTNTPGSFTCTCNHGYTGNGSVCKDFNECANSASNNCSSNATCTNTPGSFTCTCNQGYTGNGLVCADIDECTSSGASNCSPDATCNNIPSSFFCLCNQGYSGNGVTCTDIDECANTATNNCDSNAICTNSPGNFTCTCIKGYTGNGTTCYDINECANATTCNSNANCTNIPGSFTCACNQGYTGNGTTCYDINECANATTCNSNAACTNTPGSFTCTCNQGYTGNGTTCEDINECANATDNNCGSNAKCANTPGSFNCTCDEGFRGNGVSCTDIDECANATTNNCDSNANCTNTPGGFNCTCNQGYTGNGLVCKDLNECANSASNSCSSNATCTNTPGGFYCTCNQGYTGNGEICTEIDECASATTNNCDSDAICINTPGSFTCTCNQGYTGNGLVCADIDECTSSGASNCSPDATCNNIPSSFFCLCNQGYSGNGVTCTDIDECANTTMNNCDSNAMCTNTPGRFTCTCNQGYTGNGTTCEDINECASAISNNCDTNAACTNTPGNFTCACDQGYSGDGATCIDINECGTAVDNCSSNAICTNIPGGFNCTCLKGFIGNGINCPDINECANATTNNCDSNATCFNTPGSFNCLCNQGYTGDGVRCLDINECAISGLNNCSSNATCTNTVGGFNCTCNHGYTGNGVDCFDFDVCAICDPASTCINIPGNVSCKCNQGYTGNGTTCVDINECANATTNNCNSNATCTNTPGNFTCTCNRGYTGNGVRCNDINECTMATSNCSSNATCINTPGSFICTCNQGYTGNGVVCTDIDECANASSCDPNAVCTNSIGSFRCKCNQGFFGNGFTCVDVNECTATTNNCASNALCTNTPGSFTCTCNQGYTGNGTNCVVINRLFFSLRGTMYESGDTILITDIGETLPLSTFPDPLSSLVCITTNVNTECCREIDGQNVGEWYFPDGTIVPLGSPDSFGDFTRTSFFQQVRLNRNTAMGPLGTYTCVVPNLEGVVFNATINIVSSLTTTPPSTTEQTTTPQGTQVTTPPGTTSVPVTNQTTSSPATTSSPVTTTTVPVTMVTLPETTEQATTPSATTPPPITATGQVTTPSATSPPITTTGQVSTTPPGLPLPPTILGNPIASTTSITILLVQISGPAVDSYQFSYSFTIRGCGMMGSNVTLVAPTSSTMYTLTGLEENSDFTINITAINGAGSSSPVTISIRTLVAAPSASPDSPVITTSVTSASIMWGRVPCAERNVEMINGYMIRYLSSLDGVVRGSSTVVNAEAFNRTFTANGLIPRTNYTFEVRAFTSDSGGTPLTGPPAIMTGVTGIPQAVGFFLRGVLYPNNSVVSLTDIGEGYNALHCLTNLTTCCRGADGGSAGEWFLPGQTSPVIGVNSASGTERFTRSRGPSAVLLNRRVIAVEHTGLFICQVPDSSGSVRTLYAGIGLGVPVITDLHYDRASLTLTCISSGGPVDSVTWMKNGLNITRDDPDFTLTQIITNPTSASYNSTLTSNSLASLVGSFTCIVRDAAGNTDTRTQTPNGIDISNDPFVVGSRAVVNCSSDSGVVDRIEWISREREVLASGTSIQQLTYVVDPVRDDLHRSELTCIVTRNLGRVNESVSNQTLQLTIRVPENIISVNISRSGRPVAGSEFNLTCTVSELISGLTNMPSASWFQSSNNIPVTSPVTILRGDDSVAAVLQFNVLTTSLLNIYVCVGSLSSSALNNPVMVMARTNFTIQISTPTVSISAPPGPLFIGGVGNVTLTCSASLSSALEQSGNSIYRYMYSFTWLDGEGNRVISGDRTTIQQASPFTGSSTLTLSSLRTTDTNFTCRVVVSEAATLLDTSEPGEQVTILNIQIPNAPAVMIESVGESTAGSIQVLTCTVILPNVLRVPLLTQWIAPNRSIIGNGATVSGSSDRLSLTFAPLHTSHGGQYFCMASVNISDANVFISGQASYNITVQIPMPSLAITGSPVNEGFHTGLFLTLTGRAEFNAAVDTPLTVEGTWTKTNPFSNLTFNQRVSTTGPVQVQGNPMVYQASLTVNPLNAEQRDTGDYTLRLDITSFPFTTGTTVSSTRNIIVLAFPPQQVSVSPVVTGVPTAGDMYTLECNISRAPTLSNSTLLGVVWLDPNNRTISSNPNFTIMGDTSTTATVLTSRLTFSRLRTSHGGNYTCSSSMTIPGGVATDHPVSSTISVRVMTASDGVTLLPSRGGSLYVGTSLNFTCMLTVDRSLVDTDIQVSITLLNLANSTRITTSISQLNDSVYRGTAEISVLLPSNNEVIYQCISSFIPSPSTPFVMMTSNTPSNQYTLRLEALPPPVITLPPAPVTMAGQSLSFTCTASVIEYLAVDPVLEWLSSNSNPLTTMDTTNSGVEFNRTLIFNNLRTSQGDQYNCTATINVPGIFPVQSVQPLDVVVQIPTPILNISLLAPPINGTMVSLLGTARLHPSVDTNITFSGSWRRQDSSDLSPFTNITTTTESSSYTSTFTFDPLRSENADGGSYVYNVSVTPAQSIPFIMSSMDDENYTLTVQSYPDLMINDSLQSGVCMQDEAATLMGNVTLLPNTATNHTLSYTWTNPAGQPITSSNGDYVVTEGSLRVNNVQNNMGRYMLNICLDIPESNIVKHCSSASFSVSTDEPGQVTGLVCSSPANSRGNVLSFNWTPPSLNPDNVVDYVVEVTQYIQRGGTKQLESVPLSPPFSRDVKSSDTLMVLVQSGVAIFIPYRVSITPRNPAGCGIRSEIDCFTMEGVPAVAPENVTITRSENLITVAWKKLTIVEARGFVTYKITLRPVGSRKRQDGVLIMTVPGDQNSTTFNNVDDSVNYEARVGTVTSDGNNSGPDSETIAVPSVTAIPQPSVTITSSPINSHYFSGLQLNLTCRIQLQMPRGYRVGVSSQWSKSGSVLTSNSRMSVDNRAVAVGPLLYQSSLVFTSLDATRGDNGDYTCSVTVSSIDISGLLPVTVNTTHTVLVETSLFQLRLIGVGDCNSWKADTPESKDQAIVSAITSNIRPRCECSFSEDRIRNKGFLCFPSSPDAVTYRAELHGTLEASVPDLIEDITQWLSSDVSISVQLQLLTIDSSCSVIISSFNENECIQTTVPVSTDAGIGVIGIAVGIICAVIVIIVIVIIALFVFFRYRNRHNILKIDKKIPHEKGGTGVIPLSVLNPTFKDAHESEYEEIDYSMMSSRSLPRTVITADHKGEEGDYSYTTTSHAPRSHRYVRPPAPLPPVSKSSEKSSHVFPRTLSAPNQDLSHPAATDSEGIELSTCPAYVPTRSLSMSVKKEDIAQPYEVAAIGNPLKEEAKEKEDEYEVMAANVTENPLKEEAKKNEDEYEVMAASKEEAKKKEDEYEVMAASKEEAKKKEDEYEVMAASKEEAKKKEDEYEVMAASVTVTENPLKEEAKEKEDEYEIMAAV